KDGQKGFTMHNLSGTLSGAGAKASNAFKELYSVCFNNKGKETELLNDLYEAGFKPRNLSCILCGTGARASFTLKRLHSVFFDEKGKKTKLLDDFFSAGFRSSDLCRILSGAANSLENFYNFCFTEEGKTYFNHFLQEGFTISDLSHILHGARVNTCSALKDFHDVCFDDAGSKTQLLDDFYKAGFRPSDLSKILSIAGNNASTILRNFHETCFNKKSYLNHFFGEKELFIPKGLSKILDGVGIKICPTFEKLHDLCFDKAGNKTDYLNDLIKNNQTKTSEIFSILYKKVRNAPSAFLDKQNIGEEDKTTSTLSSPFLIMEQEQNSDSLQQNDSKVKRKTRKSITS
ncbi:MAG: hypothetical protein PV347_00505, partial [Rickettsiaceae bacterium]|nr:hypothetical protein [Rickettsiaceae bacterium]